MSRDFMQISNVPGYNAGTENCLKPQIKDLHSLLCSGINWIANSLADGESRFFEKCTSKPLFRSSYLGLGSLVETRQAVPGIMSFGNKLHESIFFGTRPTAMDPLAVEAVHKMLGARREALFDECSSNWQPQNTDSVKYEKSIFKSKEGKEVEEKAETQRLLEIIKIQRHLQKINTLEHFHVSASASPSNAGSSESPCSSFYDLDSDVKMEDFSPIESPIEDMKSLVSLDELSFPPLQGLVEALDNGKAVAINRKRRKNRCHPIGKPRLYNFLRELLNDKSFQSCIIWVDKDKGVFKFLDSSRVADLWGQHKNKRSMKYENFARSLRTYVQKGILTKPHSKLVYCFAKPDKEVIGTADMVAKVKKYE